MGTPISRAPGAIVILATALGFVLVQLDVSIVNVALAAIGRELRSGVDGLAWVVDAYTVAFGALLLSGGALGDRIGARRAFVGGFVIFVVASVACGFAPGAAALIGARIAQGVGAAVLIPSSLALVNAAYADDPGARAHAIGLWTAAGSVALAAGPIVGGLLVETVGWRSIFFVNAPLGAVGIWLTLRYIAETPTTDRKLDWAGQALAVAALVSLTAAVIGVGKAGLGAPAVLGGFGAAALCGGLFIVVERRSRAPMLPLDFFRRAPFRAAALIGFCINLTLYGEIFVLSLFWQRLQGYSPLQTGLAFLPFCAVLGIANVAAGRLTAALGPRRPLVAGLALALLGYALLAPIGTHTTYAALLPGIVILPLGIGLAVPAMTTALLGSVEKQRSGIAAGVLNAVRQSAGALGVAILGSLFAAHGELGVRLGFVASAVLVGLGLAVAVFGFGSSAGAETEAKSRGMDAA